MSDVKANIWLPFYVSDYLRDTGHLDTIEHGALLLLLLHAWVHDGDLPKDPDRLRRIARMDTEQWRQSSETILEFFYQADDGSYRNKRIDKEIEAAVARVEAARRAGLKSGEARRRHAKTKRTSVERGLNDSSTDVERTPERIANGTRTQTPTERERIANQSPSHTHTQPSEPDGSEVSSVSNETDAASASLAERLWSDGLTTLARLSGQTPARLRSVLGKWRKSHDDAQVLAKIVEAERQAVSEPVAWITKALAGQGQTPEQREAERQRQQQRAEMEYYTRGAK